MVLQIIGVKKSINTTEHLVLNPNVSWPARYNIFYSSHKRVTVGFGDYFASFGIGAGPQLFLLLVLTLSFGYNWGLCDLEDDPEEGLSLAFA